jgi:LysM repeat protein
MGKSVWGRPDLRNSGDWYNLGVDLKRLLTLTTLLLCLAACTAFSGDSGLPTATQVLILYQSATPTTFSPTATLALEPTSPPLPTATPFVYTVVANDTMLGIASRFGVTLEELMAVNPGVDPNFIFEGVELVIPGGEGGTLVSQPAVTPIPVTETDLFCYETLVREVWCFWLVQNDQQNALENLSATVTLYDLQGGQVSVATAVGPLNVLLPGERMPLVAYFPPQTVSWRIPDVKLLTSLPVTFEDGRYLLTDIVGGEVVIAENGLSAQVSGEVKLVDEAQQSSLLWVLAVAYDEEGRVVGVRRWESDKGIEAGKKRSYAFKVYSLGPEIDHVEVIAEARP